MPFFVRMSSELILGVLLMCLLAGPRIGFAQKSELPLIKTYTKADYHGLKQNWDIDQLSNGVICVANSAGLLTFDGSKWRKYPLPNQQPLRTIAVRSDTIFGGAYGTMGYWCHDFDADKLTYHSLVHQSEVEHMDREEIWHIVLNGKETYGQSFGRIFRKVGNGLETILPPNTIRFIYALDSILALQVNDLGLYGLKGNEILPLGIDQRWYDMRINGMVAQSNGSWVIATEHQGLFRFDGKKTLPFVTEVDDALKNEQVNKICQLNSGLLAIGTISNGLYLVDTMGALVFHFNKEKGLLNNTVLSLFEDRSNNLWVGLDDGICMVQLNSPLTYWWDYDGQLGTPYTATIFKDHFYVGTNQGLYVRSIYAGVQDQFTLVKGSQGQVWDLLEVGNQLYCGHNTGVLILEKDHIRSMTIGSGVWELIEVKQDPLTILVGTYNGVTVLSEQSGTDRLSVNRSEFAEGARTMQVNGLDCWVVSPYKGLFRLTFNDDFSEIVQTTNYGRADGLPSEFGIQLEKYLGEILVTVDHQQFRFDEQANRFQLHERTVQKDQDLQKVVAGSNRDLFYIFDNSVEYQQFNGQIDRLNLTLSLNNRSIIPIGSAQYFFCLDEGYALLDRGQPFAALNAVPPMVTELEVYDRMGNTIGRYDFSAIRTEQTVRLSHLTARIKISYGASAYVGGSRFQHQLIGFDEEWSAWQAASFKEYTNLPPGDYEFRLRSILNQTEGSISMVMEPRWYQTRWAKGGLVVLLFLMAVGVYMIYQWRIAQYKRRLQIEHQRTLNRQLLLMRNQKLEHDVIKKSKELANSTMNLVQKNEVLSSILNSLREVKNGLGVRFPEKYYQNLVRLIKRNLSESDDWSLFETNFNEVHDKFFATLKKDHPQLTPGELKLAAYLKMNLSTKEIAQLLAISSRGVENKRYRLRKKMQLNHDDNLITFLMQY